MGKIDSINEELKEIHFILSGRRDISPIKENIKLDYSLCGKGDDGGPVYGNKFQK